MPAELLREGLRGKVPRTGGVAPSRGRARPCVRLVIETLLSPHPYPSPRWGREATGLRRVALGQSSQPLLLRPEPKRVCAAGPRPTSPRESAIAVAPAELRWEGLRHKEPGTGVGAPSRGRVRRCGLSQNRALMRKTTVVRAALLCCRPNIELSTGVTRTL